MSGANQQSPGERTVNIESENKRKLVKLLELDPQRVRMGPIKRGAEAEGNYTFPIKFAPPGVGAEGEPENPTEYKAFPHFVFPAILKTVFNLPDQSASGFDVQRHRLTGVVETSNDLTHAADDAEAQAKYRKRARAAIEFMRNLEMQVAKKVYESLPKKERGGSFENWFSMRWKSVLYDNEENGTTSISARVVMARRGLIHKVMNLKPKKGPAPKQTPAPPPSSGKRKSPETEEGEDGEEGTDEGTGGPALMAPDDAAVPGAPAPPADEPEYEFVNLDAEDDQLNPDTMCIVCPCYDEHMKRVYPGTINAVQPDVPMFTTMSLAYGYASGNMYGMSIRASSICFLGPWNSAPSMDDTCRFSMDD